MRYIALEAEYSYNTIKSNIRSVDSWTPFRGLVVGNLSLGSRTKLLLGAGYKQDRWVGDTTKNEFEDAFTALAGFRFCVGDAWSVRPEVVFDKNPSPNFQTPVTSQSKYFGVRLGISRFFSRGSKTCRGTDRAPAAPAPAPAPVTPPVTPPPPPAPTASISASSSSVNTGQTVTLTWSSTNATSCTGSWMSGSATSGTQSVTPPSTTTYTITCTGAGGSATAATSVSVSQPAPPTPPPAPAAPPREIFKLEGVFFDFDKSIIKPEGKVKLDSAVTILNRYSDMRVEIQGHTDWVGTDAYNIGLGNRRANAVRDYLVSKGIAASRLSTKSFGESSPIATNETAEGRALNRRVMIIEMR
jgi:outer membrane protein OmpA-like peptidoglycan-associated protein